MSDAPDLPQPERDPERVLDALLGKADPAVAAALRESAARDPALARLAGTLRDVREAIADTPPESLFARAEQLAASLPTPPSWFDRLTASVLARIDGAIGDALGGALATPALRGELDAPLASFALGEARLDVEARRERSGSIAIRMQFDADLPSGSFAGEFAILDAASGQTIATGRLDASGAAFVRIDGDAARTESIDIALRTEAGSHFAGGIATR
jgi:hypothetical protein